MSDDTRPPFSSRLLYTFLFAAGFGYVEAMIVVYLRVHFYPDGFTFPLVRPPDRLIILELIREAATVLMLVSIAALSARRFWERFGYFLIHFGLWDLFYYLWLKATIGWPATLADWDILFLIPLPWIGPVYAPALIAVEMVICGVLITYRYARGGTFRPTRTSWALALIGTAAAFWSFMADTGAGLHGELPEPYCWPLLVVALVSYGVGFGIVWRRR